MAWEWSHESVAYDYAEWRLGKLNLAELLEIYGEWGEKLEFNIAQSSINKEFLVRAIWEHASSYDHGRTCDNGGNALWLCPYGCHTVDLDDMPDDWTQDE